MDGGGLVLIWSVSLIELFLIRFVSGIVLFVSILFISSFSMLRTAYLIVNVQIGLLLFFFLFGAEFSDDKNRLVLDLKLLVTLESIRKSIIT